MLRATEDGDLYKQDKARWTFYPPINIYEQEIESEIAVSGYLLTWDVSVTSMGPYSTIYLIYIDNIETGHGYVCDQWTAPERHVNSFLSYTPLQLVRFVGDSETIKEIKPEELPIG